METPEPPIRARGAQNGTRSGFASGNALSDVTVTNLRQMATILRFREFSIELGARLLLRNNEVVEVGGRAFDLLVVLLNSRGQVVSKADICRYVWPNSIVDESNLRFQMASLRTKLGNDRDLIKTIPGRGYLFVLESDADVGIGGTTIEFGPGLDRADASESGAASVVPLIEAEETLGSPVAIIDDNRETRESLEGLLQSAGIVVEAFPSVQAYNSRAWRSPPSCLVLDVLLPGKSGLDFQAEIVRNGLELPIIFISGHADVHMCVQAMKAGACDFLTKPVRYRDLLSAVQLAISPNTRNSNCDMGCKTSCPSARWNDSGVILREQMSTGADRIAGGEIAEAYPCT